MDTELSAQLPRDKLETERARAVIALGFPAVEPILPELVEWMQDINWPVAQTLQPFLASIGLPLAPHVRHVLATSDESWKYWVLRSIVMESPELVEALQAELRRLVQFPTLGEAKEEIDVLAKEILEARRLGGVFGAHKQF